MHKEKKYGTDLIEKLKKATTPIIISVISGIILMYATITLPMPSRVKMIEEVNAFGGCNVNGEYIIYSWSEEWGFSYEITLTNKNNVTINIKDVIIEVIDYQSIDDVTIINPAGGADYKDKLFYICRISNEHKQYFAAFTGPHEYETKDISNTNYTSIKAGDSGVIGIKVNVDEPGLYTIKAIINYTYNNKIKSKETKQLKFAHDPYEQARYLYPQY